MKPKEEKVNDVEGAENKDKKVKEIKVLEGVNTTENSKTEENMVYNFNNEIHNNKENTENYQSKIILFGTKTCPNCKVAKSLLQKAHIAFEEVDAEEKRELTELYQVNQAPTLVLVDSSNQIEKIVNVSNIKKYIMS